MSVDTAITVNIVKEIVDKIRDQLRLGKKLPQIVIIKPDPDAFTFTKIGRATTTSDKFDDESITQTITIQNPLDKDTNVKEISLVPNAGFKTNGLVIIKINEVRVYESSAAGDFTDVVDVKVKFNQGKRIFQRRDVKILIKNDDDSTSVSLAAQVTFGD